jgi:hypothetical protein
MHSRSALLQRLSGHSSELVGAAGGQQEARSLGGKGQGSGGTDAGTGAGDENDLSFETHGSILFTSLDS